MKLLTSKIATGIQFCTGKIIGSEATFKATKTELKLYNLLRYFLHIYNNFDMQFLTICPIVIKSWMDAI